MGKEEGEDVCLSQAPVSTFLFDGLFPIPSHTTAAAGDSCVSLPFSPKVLWSSTIVTFSKSLLISEPECFNL